MEYIGLDTWKRKEHFHFFHGMDYPHFNICANLDATHFLKFVKAKRISFYYAMIFASSHAANESVGFRYRIRANQVVLHDKVHPSFTDITELDDAGDDLYKLVTVEMKDDLMEFVRYCGVKSQNQKSYFDLPQQLERDMIKFYCRFRAGQSRFNGWEPYWQVFVIFTKLY
jgi:chloramphenicol O-acetyltransferase type A